MTERLDLPPAMRGPAVGRVLAALTPTGGSPPRLIGGCVRDAVLGRPFHDIDIATPLHPDAVIKALEAARIKAVPTGLKHGTVTAVADGRAFEVTTLRVDVETDGRHATVAFTDDWRADAARRDFTMNALSVTQDGALFDYFGGVADARAGRVRFIGEARCRVEEDHLRLLRFFRFHAHYGHPPPDSAALAVAASHAHALPRLSAERVRTELLKLLAAGDPGPTVALMAATGVLAVLCDGLASAAPQRLAALVALEAGREGEAAGDALRRLAALIPAPPDTLAERFRLSNAERARLRHAALAVADSDLLARPRALAQRAGVTAAVDGVLLHGAARVDQSGDAGGARQATDTALSTLAGWTAPVFPLTGGDLLALGMAPGPEIGATLRRLEAAWRDSGFTLDRATLLSAAADR